MGHVSFPSSEFADVDIAITDGESVFPNVIKERRSQTVNFVGN